jgi:hypothetical protein
VASSALAATWTMPPFGKNSTDVFACRVVDNEPSDMPVVIEIKASGGALLGGQTLTLPPGNTTSAVYGGATTPAYCVVSGSLSKSKTPATFCVTGSGSSRCEVAVTVP